MSGDIQQFEDVRAQTRVQDSADVVIIGSGAAGATAARVLAAQGIDVIVIEEGPHITTEAMRTDMYTSFQHGWRDMGFQVASGRTMTPILQGSCVGGTTVINGAIIHRMPESIHADWCAKHGASELLPFDALQRVYDTLDEELSVGTAPDAVFGRQNELMAAATTKLGWKANKVRRNVRDCEGSAHCNQGCPGGRKQSMDVAYIPRAIADGARVYATCRVGRIHQRGGRVQSVEGRFYDRATRTPGPTLHVEARHAVIVAASAIQTPLLLRDSGLGNRKRVGFGLQAHPGTAVGGVFDDPVKQWFGATQGFESTHYWDERMKFETVGMPIELAAARLPGFGEGFVREIFDYGNVAFFGVQIRARTHGRVTRNLLGGKSIRFDMTQPDIKTLKLGLTRLTELMFAAGAREVMPGIHGLPERISSPDELSPLMDMPDDPRLFHCIAAHLFGTATMGTQPQDSVVGPDCQLHDVEGLYVTDSSVFPTNMGVNPQHTICAVSWLAAERIAETVLQRRAQSAA